MALEKYSTVLKMAQEGRYCVPAFNTYNYETIAWVIEVAEEEKRPVIVQLYPGYDFYIPLKVMCDAAKELAAHASVPVCVHLDHSATYEIAFAGLAAGFPSVMIDGSSLSFDENVALTAAVSRAAHALGCEVEAELGHVGSGSNLDDFATGGKFTDPDEAVKFIELTNVDALAVSIGNAHGAYAATPNLQLDLLSKINDAVDIPLVLHGGSDIPDEQIKQAITRGIAKVNIATEYFRAMYKGYSASIAAAPDKDSLFEISQMSKDSVKDFLRGKFNLLKADV